MQTLLLHIKKLSELLANRKSAIAALIISVSATVLTVFIRAKIRANLKKQHPLKIVAIDLWHVRVPLEAPFHPSWIPGFSQEENRFDLLRIRTASGMEGWSSAPSMATEREGWGSLLGSYFLGERADDLENIRQRIREMGYLGHRTGWIECACWDAVGKARGKPVYALLGGNDVVKGGKVKLYASTGEVRTGEEAAKVVKARMAEGFDAVKIRVHDQRIEDDLSQIRICREIVGPDVVLGVDANQGWRVAVISEAPQWDYERAYQFSKAAQEAGYSWVEEPLPMDDYEGIAKLSAALEIPITGGELNNYGLPEFKIMIKQKCYDVYQPDAMMVGGVSEVWAIMQYARKYGAQYSPHTWTNGIGFAVNLHIFAASPYRHEKRLEWPLDYPGWTPKGRDGVLVKDWKQDGGFFVLPDGAGFGFDIDMKKLSQYGTRFYCGTPIRVAIRTILERGLSAARRVGAVRAQRLSERQAFLARKEEMEGYDPMLGYLNEFVKSQQIIVTK